jgi:hypothetical protein
MYTGSIRAVRNLSPTSSLASSTSLADHELNPAEIQHRTLQLLQNQLTTLEYELRELNRSAPGALNILACQEDFFRGAWVAKNACMDPEEVYRFMANELQELSARYPTTVIAPGSMYISTPIPHKHQSFSFDQDNERKRALSNTVCYVANVMPVLYGGQLMGVVRKGEPVKIQGADNKYHSLDDLNHLNPTSRFKRLKVVSYHEDELSSTISEGNKESICFAGKTLMPGEKEILQAQFGTSNCFGHNYQIAGKNFMFLICGEFRSENGQVEKSTAGKLLQRNPFDVVVHSTVGGPIPENLQPDAIYVHADGGGMTGVKTAQLGSLIGQETLNRTRRISSRQYALLMAQHSEE